MNLDAVEEGDLGDRAAVVEGVEEARASVIAARAECGLDLEREFAVLARAGDWSAVAKAERGGDVPGFHRGLRA